MDRYFSSSQNVSWMVTKEHNGKKWQEDRCGPLHISLQLPLRPGPFNKSETRFYRIFFCCSRFVPVEWRPGTKADRLTSFWTDFHQPILFTFIQRSSSKETKFPSHTPASGYLKLSFKYAPWLNLKCISGLKKLNGKIDGWRMLKFFLVYKQAARGHVSFTILLPNETHRDPFGCLKFCR